MQVLFLSGGEAVVSPPDAALPVHKSLRTRGVVVTLALLLYMALAGAYVATERMHINESVQSLEKLSRHEKALAVTEAAVSSALLDVNEASNAEHPAGPPPSELRLYMESCARLFAALDEFDPGYARLHRAIARSYDELQAQPVRAGWIELRESLSRATSELDIRRAQLADQREQAVASYQRSYDAVTIKTMLLAAIGLVLFGTLAGWFFARLARDIQRLEAHARQVVGGTRGVMLAVTREDEVGRLMHAVNRMATDLDEREQRIELERARRAHEDKMLAVGAIAAGMAHEVNNPLAVIAGTAESLKATAQERADAALAEEAERISQHARRAGLAAQGLADAAAPQPWQRDWFDLRGLVQRVVQWMHYDRRYRGFGFDVQAPLDLPAVCSSAETVQRVLTQMLSLACDAMAAQGAARTPLTITLQHADATFELRMDFPASIDLSQAEVQRSLQLGRAALAPFGAQLALCQPPQGGSQIKLVLPMNSHDSPP
jgi:two-component system, NtrC family, sensor kinase